MCTDSQADLIHTKLEQLTAERNAAQGHTERLDEAVCRYLDAIDAFSAAAERPNGADLAPELVELHAALRALRHLYGR